MRLLHGSYTLIYPDRKGPSSHHPSSGLRYSLRSSGWSWRNAVWRHLVKSSRHGSFWLGLLYSTSGPGPRRCGPLVCLRLRKPVGKEKARGRMRVPRFSHSPCMNLREERVKSPSSPGFSREDEQPAFLIVCTKGTDCVSL